MGTNKYSVTEHGYGFVSPHFQVKEFATDKTISYVVIRDELIEKLELLSDCVNNKPIIIDKGNCDVESTYGVPIEELIHGIGLGVDIHVNGFNANDLAVLAEACGFNGVGVIDSKKIHVDVYPDEVRRFYTNGKDEKYDIHVASFFTPFWYSDDSWLHIRAYDFSNIDHCGIMETREPVKKTVEKFNEYDLIMNGGFWCTYKEPQFNLKIHGRILKDYMDHKWGMIFTKDRIRYGEMSTGNTFVSGHPVLLDNGSLCNHSYASEIEGFRQRAAIGCDNDTFFGVACDAKPGLSLRGIRQVMKYIGCANAINLDGGGSTSMGGLGKMFNKQTDQRCVNNCIYVKLKTRSN